MSKSAAFARALLFVVTSLVSTGVAGSTLAGALLAQAPNVEVAGEARHESQLSRQESQPWESFDEVRLGLLAGLIQPILLGGGNVEVDLYYRRFVFGYSHGFALNLEGSTVIGDAKEQGLSFHLPYSTGFSIGYRLLEWLDFRVEGKAHRFEVSDADTEAELFAYTTFTLGFGMYAQYRPFFHFGVDAADWLQGFVAITSVRYWPNVGTSLSDDEEIYANPRSNTDVRHRAANIGIANTPFLFNVSLGYLFTF